MKINKKTLLVLTHIELAIKKPVHRGYHHGSASYVFNNETLKLLESKYGFCAINKSSLRN
jgi:hypothetical protein